MNSKKNKTVLIIGAGASHDLHSEIALGKELFVDITNRVTDRTAKDPYLSVPLDNHGYKLPIRQLFVCMADKYAENNIRPSIDDFLFKEISKNEDNVELCKNLIQIGKFMIISHIRGYEGVLKTNLEGPNPFYYRDTWLSVLIDFLKKNGLGENLRIITFNYDRIVEHVLYNHFKGKNRVEEIKNFLSNSVEHVYGKIGHLDWEEKEPERTIEFGEVEKDKKFWDKILNNIELINTMSLNQEEIKKTENYKKIIQWLGEADRVGVLGFGFDTVNSKEMLTLDKFSNAELFAHVHNRNDYDLLGRITSVNKDAKMLMGVTCTEFLKCFLNAKQHDI